MRYIRVGKKHYHCAVFVVGYMWNNVQGHCVLKGNQKDVRLLPVVASDKATVVAACTFFQSTYLDAMHSVTASELVEVSQLYSDKKDEHNDKESGDNDYNSSNNFSSPSQTGLTRNDDRGNHGFDFSNWSLEKSDSESVDDCAKEGYCNKLHFE